MLKEETITPEAGPRHPLRKRSTRGNQMHRSRDPHVAVGELVVHVFPLPAAFRVCASNPHPHIG